MPKKVLWGIKWTHITIFETTYKLLKELHNIGYVQDLEGWSKKLDDPAPNWLVFLLLNTLRKDTKGVGTDAVIKAIIDRLEG
jgi:hypothetical protein